MKILLMLIPLLTQSIQLAERIITGKRQGAARKSLVLEAVETHIEMLAEFGEQATATAELARIRAIVPAMIDSHVERLKGKGLLKS